MIDRRDALRLGALAGLAAGSGSPALAAAAKAPPAGVEGQRRADLGDGTYLNPILAGDDLASLRPALFASGRGMARFRDYRYRALKER